MPQQRAPLSRDRVLMGAVALADRIGIEALSMRRLAHELGVVPMALYKHVANRDDLLDGMVDAVIAELEEPPEGLAWQDVVRHRVLSARRAVGRHAWARRAIESRTRRTPTVLAHMDAVAGGFLAGGCSADLTHHLMHALGNRIWGFSPELFDAPPDPDAPAPDAETAASAMAEMGRRYPHILAIASAATDDDLGQVGEGCDEDFEFTFALDLLLDAAERLRRDGWTRARTTVSTPAT
jgi:AcrR family transcriptional regulator